MRRIQRGLALLAALFVAVGISVPATAAPAAERELTILFTHDTHDHFLPARGEAGEEYGGYTRLATALNVARAQAETPTVTLDAGDFAMGSLFQTIYATDAPELRALGAMGYDATTLGNHEFDYRQQGLAEMLSAALQSGDHLPAIVQANYTTPRDPVGGAVLTEALGRYPVTDYAVIARDGLRVAVFGVLGVDADASAPMSDMVFEPIADAARRVVAEIKSRENADYIICLSHSGLNEDPKQSEDQRLAEAVDGIDVIISGHTHSTTQAPLRVKNTLIVSCGPYTQNLGVLKVSKGADAPVEAMDYRLVPIDERIPEDPGMAAMAEKFQSAVSTGYLSDYGLTFNEVLTQSAFGMSDAEGAESTLGNLIADAYLYAVRQAEGADYVPVDFAVVPSGVIRGALPPGGITTSAAFDVSSLGVGADGTPGYPLVSVYLTGKELRAAFEVDASVAPLMPAARLYGAGMTWTYNPHRMIFNRVTDCAQVGADGVVTPIESTRLYRVVTGLYSGQMLESVNGKSFGILSIVPKGVDGTPVTNFEEHIIYNADGAEVKEWYALASYLQSMETVDQRYAAPEGRKTEAPSWNPFELLRSPNWITLTVLAVVAAIILLVVLVVRGLMRRTGGGNRYRSYRGQR